MIKVGIIGAGLMGRLHAKCYSQMESVCIEGISDIDKEKGEKLAKEYRCKFYEDPDVLINESKTQVIDICTPTPSHRQFTLHAAKVGKSIICEKPIARTLRDAERMVEEAEKRGVFLLIGHVVRFFPQYIKVKELIEKGEIGQPAVVRTFRGVSPSPSFWYRDVEKSGGILLDFLIHDFDFLCWVFGKVDTVYAQNVFFNFSQRKGVALVNLKFQTGVLAHVEGSWAHPKDFPFTTKLEVTGDKGLIQFDSSESMPVIVYKDKVRRKEERVPENLFARDPYFVELEHFISCIQEKEKPKITPQDAVQALKISLASLESTRTGRPVKEGEIN